MSYRISIIFSSVLLSLHFFHHRTAGDSRDFTRSHTIPALLDGDVIIGVLFSLHYQPKQEPASNTISCGKIREAYGIQRTEVTFQTIDEINKNPKILPNITLGVEVRDSCWYAPVALQQSIEFIRDAISLTGDMRLCAERSLNETQARRESVSVSRSKRAPLIGVIGPGSSSVALQVQNLLQLFQIPQIGYSTTSRDLSDKSRFSYFLRVVPSDYYQAKVMVDIVKMMNWTYVSAVNTEENYGQSGIQAFRELAEKANVCIAKEGSVLSNAEDKAFDDVLLNLKSDENARVVVCFCEGMTVRGLLAASRRLNLTGHFLFLGSEGWADRSEVTDGYEYEAKGSISIRIHSSYVSGFDKYYFGLNPFNNTRNPWFREFWENQFNCEMPSENRSRKSGKGSLESRKICTGNEKISEKYKQEPKMSFVVKAIYAMAHGLHNMVLEVCGSHSKGLCPAMFPFNGSLFKEYLMDIRFEYEEEVVNFDSKGDPPGRYNIMNFQQLPNGTYEYIQVGNWMNGSLSISKPLQFSHTQQGEKIESVCSKPCAPGYYRNFQTGGQEKKCCWACVPCNQSEILVNVTTCKPCAEGFRPNVNKTACDEIPPEFTRWNDTEAIIAMAFSCFGFISTLFVGFVFIKYNDTPVVKSSTRELSYIILAGVSLSNVATIPILAKPSPLSCIFTRILPGLSFAMMYASLLTKTNRIARILAGSKKRFINKKLRFMSGAAQVVITSVLISIEIVIASAMLIMEPAAPHLRFFTNPQDHTPHAFLECNTTPYGVLVPLAFDFFLIALCTLYALKTRNVPENFNEAKFIGFAMYTTCVIWVAFGPIYFKSGAKVITMCVCVTLSAMVILVFLFVPKLYIILLRPEKNTRAHFTTSKTIRCYFGNQLSSNALCHKCDSFPNSFPLPKDKKFFCEMTCASGEYLENAYKFINKDRTRKEVLFDSQCDRKEVTKRTLSCQTDVELIHALVESYSKVLTELNEWKNHQEKVQNEERSCEKNPRLSSNAESEEESLPRWAKLSTSELLQNIKNKFELAESLREVYRRKTNIIEESITDDSDSEHNGKYKKITIRLGDFDGEEKSHGEELPLPEWFSAEPTVLRSLKTD